MQTELLRIWEQGRKTVVFVTHQIDEAVFLADRVLVFARRPGRLQEAVTIDLPRPRGARHQAQAGIRRLCGSHLEADRGRRPRLGHRGGRLIMPLASGLVRMATLRQRTMCSPIECTDVRFPCENFGAPIVNFFVEALSEEPALVPIRSHGAPAGAAPAPASPPAVILSPNNPQPRYVSMERFGAQRVVDCPDGWGAQTLNSKRPSRRAHWASCCV